MGKLRDFFRPRWKHSDYNVRRAAVDNLTNHAILRLLFASVLSKIAESDKDLVVRFAAVRGLTDQAALARIAENDKSWEVRMTAVKNPKLTDKAILAKIARNDEDAMVRKAAVDNPNLTDRTILAEIAKNDNDYWVCKAAGENLTDKAVLAKIAKNDKLVEELTEDLYNVGLSDGFLSTKPGSRFDDNCKNIRAREIGERLDQMGGFQLMRLVHGKIERMKGAARQLESCWGYIGSWRP